MWGWEEECGGEGVARGDHRLQSLADRTALLPCSVVVSLGGAHPGPSPLQHLGCHCYLFSKTLPHSISREKFLFSLRQLVRLRNFWYVLQ